MDLVDLPDTARRDELAAEIQIITELIVILYLKPTFVYLLFTVGGSHNLIVCVH